jgi:hypothetical protein
MDMSFEFLLKKLMENETAVGDLYAQFSVTFPSDSVFWNDLSLQEQEHARWIGQLRDLARKDHIKTRDAIYIKAVETSIKYIKFMLEKCKKGGMSRENAFTLAFDIENSLIEKKFFEVFGFENTPFRIVLDELIEETGKHRKKIGEALHSLKTEKKKP